MAAPKKQQPQKKYNRIRIRIKAYDHRALDKAVRDITDAAKRSGTRVAGPIPLPTKCERFTVLRSPHIDRKSREQFEMRTHLRLIDLIDPTSSAIETLQKLQFPAGLDISIDQKHS